MAKVRFYIQSKHEGQPATVYFRFSDGRKTDIWTPTPIKLFPEHWNNKSQSFKQRIVFTQEFSMQDKDRIEEKFLKLKSYMATEMMNLNGTPPTKDWIKNNIDKYYHKQSATTETLNEYIDRFLKDATSGKRLCFSANTKKAYSSGTLRNFRDFQNAFDLYQGIYKESKRKRVKKDEAKRPYKPLNFEDITIDFYNDWLRYFYDKNCGANYIGKHLKTLKTIMRQSRDEGLHTNTEIERKAFKTISEEVDSIYLTEDDLSKLFNIDLSSDKIVEISRDVFLCGCYTAQRYSDYGKISKENIKNHSGVKVIEIVRQQKTGQKCIIPIRPELELILKKYDYTLPKTYEQMINENIKIAGKRAGIDDIIYYEENRGGFKVKKKAHKYDLMRTHTARRSGCTNMYIGGVKPIDAMKISGHKTEREFLKYIKVTKEQTAISLSSHPYFVQNKLKVL